MILFPWMPYYVEMEEPTRKPGRPRESKRRGKLARQIIALREVLGESTKEFGDRFCRSGRTVEEWEQERRVPDPLIVQMIEKLAARRL